MNSFNLQDHLWMDFLLCKAEKTIGRTAPNPPVAAGIVSNGQLIGLGIHEGAGTPHAEVVAIADAQARSGDGGPTLDGATLYVTLEPCNHTGRTPPCTEAILKTGIRRVVVGMPDPNPRVCGGGFDRLKQAGLSVAVMEAGATLIAPFAKHSKTGQPWVTLKVAYRQANHAVTLFPPPGQTTFTGPAALRRAHLERRRADAILTGMGTVLADWPQFTVRHVTPHPPRRRPLVVLTRRPPSLFHEIPGWTAWINRQQSLGFSISTHSTVEQALDVLGRQGVLRVLVEAGPTLSETFLRLGLSDESLFLSTETESE